MFVVLMISIEIDQCRLLSKSNVGSYRGLFLTLPPPRGLLKRKDRLVLHLFECTSFHKINHIIIPQVH